MSFAILIDLVYPNLKKNRPDIISTYSKWTKKFFEHVDL